MGIIEDYYNYDLEELQHFFENTKMTLGRKILEENIEENFGRLRELGLRNLKDLLAALKTKEKVKAFSEKSGISTDYLVVFRRQLHNYFPEPVKLERIADIKNNIYLKKLKQFEITTTFDMLEAGRTKQERENLTKKTGIPESYILELVKLSDLCRIYGVKDTRAKLYYKAGVDTLEKIAKWDPVELRKTLLIFVEKTKFKGIAPLPAEAAFTVAQAKKIPRIVEY